MKATLLAEETVRAGTLVISVIYGFGGLGKSALASALTYDPEIQLRFSDGVFWATLGQQPDILSVLSKWIRNLGDYDFKPIDVDEASLQLKTLLSGKKALLVIDDVWNPDDVEPFRMGCASGCQILVTTREAPVQGAIRHELDVMTSKESVALLTAFLEKSLTGTELRQAETLAKEVGYLPLALELAAAQISEGLSWSELLSELQTEIALLETLDRWDADEATSEDKRKNYSLLASFNLSLKRLSPDRLEKFAWLGVLPDDVTITDTMATTLWRCNRVQAKKTLKSLRGKALLLFGVSSEEETNYRIHDLLHDLARNLLTDPITPEDVGKLPGLGVPLPEAHQQLLEQYQKKTKDGLWHSLPDDGYICDHLIWHLEKAGKIDEIHQLLREETPQGENGWYWQCDRQGKTTNFVKDVSKAWEIAEESWTINQTESIHLQCRYALILASLNSLAGNIPPKLIAALVNQKIWTPAQGLAYVKQNKNDKSQASGLRELAQYLPPALLTSALKTAQEIGDEGDRADALIGLASYLPHDLLPEALDAARGIKDEGDRADALIGLAPYLPQDLLPEALEAVREIENGYSRAHALGGLAPHLPQDISIIL
ncbi:MAG: NB-ARC domain-containing protein [Snowella sp.]|nr:NB-ARC domain-containing protein [Snowella sp.]